MTYQTQDEWKLQASIKLGPNQQHMINVRASSVNELLELLDGLNGSSGFVNDQISEISDGLRYERPATTEQAVANIKAEFPQTQQIHQGQANPPEAYGPPPGPPVCKHGQMKFYEGPGKNGNFRAYFCPQPKGSTQCPAKFLD